MIVIKTTIMIILRGTAINIQLSSSDACTAKVLFLKQTLYFIIHFLYYSDILNCTLVDECHVSQLKVFLITCITVFYMYEGCPKIM